MKKTKRLWALLLAMVMALGLISTAFAAPTIDSGRKASLSLYKYDITAASEDGAWNTASYVSTGVQDDTVTDKLAQYAIQGVEFTYLRVADIAMNNELVDGQRQVGVLYGFAEGTVLQAIGLTAADAHKSENGTRYYYNAGRKGSIETMPDTPGLAVWKSGHIGVYIGSGEVIEAMDTRYGVVKTKLQGRGWSHWLEVPGIKYD